MFSNGMSCSHPASHCFRRNIAFNLRQTIEKPRISIIQASVNQSIDASINQSIDLFLNEHHEPFFVRLVNENAEN